MTVLSDKPPVPDKKTSAAPKMPVGAHDDDLELYDESLRRKTRWSILWTVVRIASDQVFSFVVFVVLARLLSPADFGAFALAMAFAEVTRVIAISGMVQN